MHLQRETAGTEAEITLQSPASLYDKIVVLDAGHGGNDVGETVVEQDVSLQEKDITLAAVQKAGELLLAQGIRVYYTREDDSSRSPEERVGFANALQADMLISVHEQKIQRSTESGQNTTRSILFRIFPVRIWHICCLPKLQNRQMKKHWILYRGRMTMW